MNGTSLMRPEPTPRFRPRKDVRREEKQRLREEGRAAFLAGRSRQACQQLPVLDQVQWRLGYDCAEAEFEAEDLA